MKDVRPRYRMARVAAAALASAVPGAAVPEEAATPHVEARIEVHESVYSLAPFGEVHVFLADGPPRGVALFLSDDRGWDGTSTAMARSLADEHILVAGISTPALLKAMEHGGKCVDPNYPFVDLSRDIQHRMRVGSYMKPVIVGYGAGGTLAYGALSQWSNAAYQGAVSMAFTPTIAGHRNWCKAPGFVAQRTVKPTKGWRFVPGKQVKVPWIVIQGRDETAYDPQQMLRFVAGVPGAKLVQLPAAPHIFADPARWSAQLKSAVTSLLPPPLPKAAPGQIPIPDLPITLVPATRPGPRDVMAVIYSGDGGWVGIDRDIAAQLASAGIPVVGIDSLSYFWTARTPRGAGRDLGQVVNAFSQRWNRPKVLLIGYSFGADAMPYMIQNMDADARAKIFSVSLLGFGATAEFQFHLMSWLDMASNDALPTIPAVSRLKGMTIRCVRGAIEVGSACTSMPRGLAQQFLVPGDHHFNRNAPLLARIILGQRQPGAVNR